MDTMGVVTMAFSTPPKTRQIHHLSFILEEQWRQYCVHSKKNIRKFITTIPFCLCLFLSFFVLEVVVVVMMVIEEGECVVGRGWRVGE